MASPPDVSEGEQLTQVNVFTSGLEHFRNTALDLTAQSMPASNLVTAERISNTSQEVAVRLERYLSSQSYTRLDASSQQEILRHLAGIADSIDPLLQNRRGEILVHLMNHLDPRAGEVNQGMHAVCGSAAERFALVRNDPAEYVRRVAGLVSHEAGVELANGMPLERVDESIAEDFSAKPHGEIGERDIVERIYDTAFMRLATGNYDNRTDHSLYIDDRSGKVVSYRGLHDEQLKKVIEASRGVEQRAIYDPEQAMLALKMHISELPTVSVNWAESGPHSYHAVSVSSIDEEKGLVYFYNPHGTGTNVEGPAGRSYDPSTGLESMSIADFSKRIHVAFVSSIEGEDHLAERAPELGPIETRIPTGPIPALSFEKLGMEMAHNHTFSMPALTQEELSLAQEALSKPVVSRREVNFVPQKKREQSEDIEVNIGPIRKASDDLELKPDFFYGQPKKS